MPNWCNNIVEITGPFKTLSGFKEVLDRKADLFEKFYPQPADVGDDWYDWRASHWGTKWDIPHNELDVNVFGTEKIVMSFSSAWAPPAQAFKKISGDFPELTFTCLFDEPGMCFEGKFVFEGGETQEAIERYITSDYFTEDGEENEDYIELVDRFND